MKSWLVGNFFSKTTWFNSGVAVAAYLYDKWDVISMLIPPEQLPTAAAAVGAINLVLRQLTTKSITAKGSPSPQIGAQQGGFARVDLLLFLAITFALLASVSGCATNPSTGKQELTPAGKLALQETAAMAARRYVREHPDADKRIQNIREVALKLQTATSYSTLADLKVLAIEEINKRVSNEYDRLDAISLVNMFEIVLGEQVGNADLQPEALVQINEFLSMLVAALPPARPQ
jgi:hypothetical protein